MTALWVVKLDRTLTKEEERVLMLILPEQRRERLLRMKRTEKRCEPLCAYGLLHAALLNRHPELQALPDIKYGPLGKPEFAEYPDIHFSISHTDGAVLVGVSDWPIGVDIEKIRPVRDALVTRLGGDTPEAFFRGWTRREARAKRAGSPVALGEEPPLSPEERIFYPALFSGFVSCVCGTDVSSVEIFEYSMDELMLRLRI